MDAAQANALYTTWSMAAGDLERPFKDGEVAQLEIAARFLLDEGKDLLPWDAIAALDEYLEGYFTGEEFAARQAKAEKDAASEGYAWADSDAAAFLGKEAPR